MCKTFTRLISVLLICLLFAGFCAPSVSAEEVESSAALGVLWDEFAPNDQVFRLTLDSRIYIVSESEPSAELVELAQLIQYQYDSVSYGISIVWGPLEWAKAGDICLNTVSDSSLGTEGFKLDITSKAIISANTIEGMLYGSNAFLKHLLSISGATIEGFTAKDVPDTKQRAVSLDCGRKYYTKAWICNFIRQMSWMGYNTLELHFSDDSGFRIDIWDSAYYKGQFQPANDFTWLAGSHVTSWTISDYRTDPDKDKYLTTAELVEILEVAKQYHIEVIPAFDSPSHLDYTTWKYEQNYKSNPNYSFYSTYDKTTYEAKNVGGCINYTGKKDATTPLQWPYYTSVNLKDAQSKAFIMELYIDIANFFKEYSGSTNFSIGADEVQLNKNNLASGYSYTWGFSDFVAYINELNKLLNGMGYTMRMYNDFMGSTSYNGSSYTFDDNIQILYWDSPFDPNTGANKAHTEPVSYYVNQGRTLYNCIQTNTYYVLRITENGTAGLDARSPNTTWWTFYHSTEDLIYNEWYPADISEHGLKSEDVADVPDANLGGAYFLIWSDYAAVNTEQEIWNGVDAKTSKNAGEHYSLIKRMWSNSIKMWNWDINKTVSYNDFASLCSRFTYYLGSTRIGWNGGKATDTQYCAPVTPTRAYRADHTALREAIAEKLPKDGYTPMSYVAYEKAYENAVALDQEYGASAEELAAAVYNLHNAKSQLIPEAAKLTVLLKTTVNGSEKTLDTIYYSLLVNDYRVYIPLMTGYTYTSCDGGTFTPLATNDGSGYLSGRASKSTTVTIWFQNTPDLSPLNYMLRNVVSEQGNYTAESWATYQQALNNATNFSISSGVTQADIDGVMAALEAAQNALVVECDETKIVSVECLNPVARLNKQVAVRIVTTPNVASIDISSAEGSEELDLYVGKVQAMSNGETLKLWLVYIPADEVGTFTYTITAGSATETFNITVQ